MNQKERLYRSKHIYDTDGTKELFEAAVMENVRYHICHCKTYRKLTRAIKQQRSRETANKTDTAYDVTANVMPLPTSYLKQYHLHSMPKEKMVIKATSFGTSGKKSLIGYDMEALRLGARMVVKIGRYHHLFSVRPVNYLILGYEPSKSNHTIITKTAHYATYFAPAKSKTYALTMKDGSYRYDEEAVLGILKSYSKQRIPVRIIGFPSYCYYLLKRLEQENIKVTLPEGSMVMLGGGWKQHTKDAVSKEVLYSMIEARLGIPESNIREFFGAAEHPAIYCTCKNHHFHVPVYSRVLVRDVHTLEPVGFNKPGLLNFISPLLKSVPVTSILTDDLGILHEGSECGCGITAPYFECLGRAGLDNIVTCAANASKLLQKEEN